jgi:hypothetical protein
MKAQNTGVELPSSFDVGSFDSVTVHLAPYQGSHPVEKRTFSAAWNAVGYRYRAAHEYHEEFSASVSVSATPGGDVRYRQDHCLFGFASSGLSSLECICFASHCIGSICAPAAFPISAASDLRQITPDKVLKRLRTRYPAHVLTVTMAAVLSAVEFSDLSDLRNFLSHRGTLLRDVRIGGQSEGTYVAANPTDPVSQWQLTREVNAKLTDVLMHYIESSTRGLIRAMAVFARSELPALPAPSGI